MTDTIDQLRRFQPGEPPDPDLAAAARGVGLLDLAIATVEGPLGPLLLARSPRGLVRLAYLDVEDVEEVLERLARRVSPRILRAPSHLDAERRALEAYLAGRSRTLDVDVDLTLTTPFGRAVLDAAARIPYGQVVTYAELAGRIGRPTASRAVGNALGANPVPIVVPCHRIVRTGGGLGGYVGGLATKTRLLELERAPLGDHGAGT